MWIFKLETGVATIVYIDLMMFMFAFTTSNIKLKQFESQKDGDSSQKKSSLYEIGQGFEQSDGVQQTYEEDQFVLFNILTDYTMLVLFAVKIYTALKFIINLIWIGRMDEEFLL